MITPQKRQGSLTRKNNNRQDSLSDNRVCLYTRVSTTEQKLSPQAQLQSAQRFAEQKNLIIHGSFFESKSAKKTSFRNREAVRELLTHLKKNGINTILIIRLDRAFRNLLDCVNTIDEFAREGIHFRMIEHDIDPKSMAGKVFITVMAMMAEFQCDIRSDNQVAAFDILRQQRILRNNNPPYGWDTEDTPTAKTKQGRPTYHLIANPREQKILRQMMDRFNSGDRISHIANWLNDQGIPTKKAGQLWRGKPVSGRWHPLTVQRTLEHADFATEEEIATEEQSPQL